MNFRCNSVKFSLKLIKNETFLRFMSVSHSSNHGPIGTEIITKLNSVFYPQDSSTIIELIDESHKHSGHSGIRDMNRTTETHFKVKIVSNVFENMKLIHRHRLVYDTLNQELKSSVHALQIQAQTHAEFNQK
uniref:Uncharacterized protein n=1 Tax=Timspurckia oligopyrenoides TaxID=708627 RepID=A0A7S1ESC2_9RHOD|mmetsp:Transcript_4779/g.8339  ORF Transcript_4779/g.8339 Transcript_4779/m.8339 type:complete len:132 (+) Transcript_4779:86-481(+)